jgi:hypothetical protein
MKTATVFGLNLASGYWQVVVGLLEDVTETLRHSTEAILAAITLTSCTGWDP